MNPFAEALVFLLHAGLALWLIGRPWLAARAGVPALWLRGVFAAKLLCGFAMSLIYTYYYTDRATADIFKYFDDGKVLYDLLRTDPAIGFRILLGLGDNSPLFESYYDCFGHWNRPYGPANANDTHTLIRFNALLMPVSFGSYHVHSAWANMLSMMGLIGLLKVFNQVWVGKVKWLFAAVFLMPGVLFWGSGVLKEPFVIGGMGLTLFGFFRLIGHGPTFRALASLLLGGWLLYSMKAYILLAMCPAFAILLLSKQMKWLEQPSAVPIAYLIAGAMALLAGFLSAPFDVAQKLAQKQHDFVKLARGGTYVVTDIHLGDTLYIPPQYHDALIFSSNKAQVVAGGAMESKPWRLAHDPATPGSPVEPGTVFALLQDHGRIGSTIEIPALDGTVLSLLRAAPVALLNALFRPFPWQASSPLLLMAALESLLVGWLMLLAVLRPDARASRSQLFYLAVCSAGVVLLLTGLVTPVIGSIVRYRVPALLLLCPALVGVTRFSNGQTTDRHGMP